MKFVVISLLLFNSLLSVSQTWVQLPNFSSTKRDDGVAVVVNDKIYIGTGLQEGWSATADFQVFDVLTRSWTKIQDMPQTKERQYASAFAGTNCFYVFGGDGVGGALNTMFKYDIVNATWTAVSSKPGTGLVGASCMTFGDKVIFVGGKTHTIGVLNNEVWEYNISTDVWNKKNDLMFLPRWRSSAAVIGGFGYLIFGQDMNDSCRKEFYKYDHVNDTWIQLNNFPLAVGRSYSAMQNVNDRLVLFAGVTCLGQSYNDLWHYNRFTDTWLQDVSVPSIERRGGMSCAVGNSFYYSCGIDKNNARLNETWMTDIPLSNDKITKENNYQVLPNPVNSELHIILKSIAIDFTNVQLDLYDIFGKEINGITVQHLSDTEKLIWLAHLNSGVYFLKISLKNGSWQMKKIIKN